MIKPFERVLKERKPVAGENLSFTIDDLCAALEFTIVCNRATKLEGDKVVRRIFSKQPVTFSKKKICSETGNVLRKEIEVTGKRIKLIDWGDYERNIFNSGIYATFELSELEGKSKFDFILTLNVWANDFRANNLPRNLIETI